MKKERDKSTDGIMFLTSGCKGQIRINKCLSHFYMHSRSQ